MASKSKPFTPEIPEILILNDETELLVRASEFQDSPEAAQETFPKMTRETIEGILTIHKVNTSAIRPDGSVDMERVGEITQRNRGTDELAQALLRNGKHSFLASNLEHFVGIGKDTALQLIDAGYARQVMQQKCNALYKPGKEIALRLLQEGETWAFEQDAAYTFFHDLDTDFYLQWLEICRNPLKVAYGIIQQGHRDADFLLQEFVSRGWEKDAYPFLGQCKDAPKHLLVAVLESSAGEAMGSFTKRGVETVGAQKLAEALIEANQGGFIAEYEEYFESLDKKELIRQMAQAGQVQAAQELLDMLSIEEQAELYDLLSAAEDLPFSVKLFDQEDENSEFSDRDSEY